MSNSAQQAQAYSHAPLPYGPYHPPRPGALGQYPNPQNVPYVPSPRISPSSTPRGHRPQVPQLPPHTYNVREAPKSLPPTNKNMPVKHFGPRQGEPGVSEKQAVPPKRNSSAGSQTPAQAHAANSNPSTQSVPPKRDSSARPQASGHVANSNPPAQYISTNTSPGSHPGLYHVSPAPRFTPQATQWAPQHLQTPQCTPPHSNMDCRPSQGMGSNGQISGQTYGQIISGHLVPQVHRRNGYEAVGPTTHQMPDHAFNGGSSPAYMPISNASYQAYNQAPPARPVPQPTTRYNLPPSSPRAPQPFHGRIASQPGVFNGNMSHGGDMSPPGNMHPASNTPHSNMVPPPAHQSAMKSNAKRPADQPLPQQRAKKQRKPVPVAPAQQPSQPIADANQVISDQLAAPAPPQVVEPQHLPAIDLVKIETSFVIEPDTEKPLPKGKTAIAWDKAIERIVDITQTYCGKSCILRPEPLSCLRELSNALEVFIAQPGRRALLVHEPNDLLNVRYIRVIEDGIWLEFDCIPDRDYDTATAGDKEKVVREAWEKRERERAGPTLEEAQRQIFKWDRLDRLGFGKMPATQENDPEPEE